MKTDRWVLLWFRYPDTRAPSSNKQIVHTYCTCSSPLLLLLALLLLAAAEQAANGTASALGAVARHAGGALCTVSDARDAAVHGAGAGDVRGRVAAVLALALALGAVGALLGGEVADGLQEAALADLPADEVVDAVLEGVDLLDARDLGLVEVFWGAMLVTV